MKMMCPQCGVKGSAPSSQLGKKVRCPKCTTIFTISSEVVQTIPMEEIELEELLEQEQSDPGLSSEEEIDDVFSKLLEEEEESSVSEEDAMEDIFGEQDEADDEVIAALSDEDVQQVTDEQWADDDDTLTIIEDIPEEAGISVKEVAEEQGDRITLDDMDYGLEAEKLQDEEPTVEEEDRIILDDMDEEFAADELQDEESAIVEEDRITLDDMEEAFEAGEGEEEELLDAEEEDELRLGDEEDYLELDEQTAALEIEGNVDADGEETFVDEEEMEEVTDDAAAEITEAEEIADEEDDETEEESEVTVQKCAACDEYVDPDEKHDFDGNVYCSKCVPSELKKDMEKAAASAMEGARQAAEIDAEPGRFTLTTLIKDAWHYSKGAKGSIWAGLIVMYLLLFAAGAAIAMAMPFLAAQGNPKQAVVINVVMQVVLSFISYVFTAGIILIAVNKIGQKKYSWKMVFSGFRRFGAMIGLFILQIIMLIIGFALFILPGIYLSVGYVLAIPLLFERRLSPWQALETSRKAVHKRWWTVFFTFIIMVIFVSISSIPLGIGLIWTIPMFVILVGVLYYHFFGADE